MLRAGETARYKSRDLHACLLSPPLPQWVVLRVINEDRELRSKSPHKIQEMFVPLSLMLLYADFTHAPCRILIPALALETRASRLFSNKVLWCSIEPRSVKPRDINRSIKPRFVPLSLVLLLY